MARTTEVRDEQPGITQADLECPVCDAPIVAAYGGGEVLCEDCGATLKLITSGAAKEPVRLEVVHEAEHEEGELVAVWRDWR